jgi:hypothetical protein
MQSARTVSSILPREHNEPIRGPADIASDQGIRRVRPLTLKAALAGQVSSHGRAARSPWRRLRLRRRQDSAADQTLRAVAFITAALI